MTTNKGCSRSKDTISTREDHDRARWATIYDDLRQNKDGVGEATSNAQRNFGMTVSILISTIAIGDFGGV